MMRYCTCTIKYIIYGITSKSDQKYQQEKGIKKTLFRMNIIVATKLCSHWFTGNIRKSSCVVLLMSIYYSKSER